jgi:hypothetical protein
MNTKTIRFAVLCACLFTFSAASFAESTTVRANIPFSFIAAGRIMPAGEYLIQEASESGVLIVKGPGPGSAIAVLTIAGPTAADASEAGLSFARSASGVYLSKVQMPGSPAHLLILPEHGSMPAAARPASETSILPRR